VALAGRVVLLGLAPVGAGAVGGDAHRGIGGRDLRERTSFKIGIEIALAPELHSPMYAIALSSCAALRAFADVASGVQVPAWAVESSSEM
jgi:hypothetical protein